MLLGLGYVYNGIFGIDLGYGYSLNDKKDIYTFSTEEGASVQRMKTLILLKILDQRTLMLEIKHSLLV